jgi:hypothetical protein
MTAGFNWPLGGARFSRRVDEKEIAIQSTDLIYKQSTLSLGLLIVRIDSKEKIERLRDLICGNCVAKGQSDQGRNEYSLEVPLKEAQECYMSFI